MRRQTDARIETTLSREARLAAELIARSSRPTCPSVAELDDEADRIGQLLDARVTFIAADGRVVGDSSETLEALATMENHAHAARSDRRPRERASGARSRYSATLKIDMLYVAVPVAHPAMAFVRMALPLTDVRQQLRPILTATLVALGFALVGAGAIAWMFSARIGRRVRRDRAARRALPAGRPHAAALGFGDDELGTVARALDDSVQEVGRRLAEQARDRARMEAILAGMVEGVIVVDPQGRLQLVEPTPRSTCCGSTTVTIGRHYVETIRHAGDRGAGRGCSCSVARRTRCSCRRRAIHRAPSWRGRAGGRHHGATASCWCCTTSPSCGAPTRSAATSSPTCRTSCGRR